MIIQSIIKYCLRRGIAAVGLLCLLFSACAEDLFETTNKNDDDGMMLNLTTVEMADEQVRIGGTRAESGIDNSDNNIAHLVEGDNPYHLNVQRMPLPLVGIHSAAAKAGNAGNSEITRASIDDIASTENFHDSLTLWGFLNNNAPLYNQVLVTKVTNWRTSVQWPYNSNENFMKFYALSPSMESTDVTINTAPGYSTKPVFTYKLPDTAGELVDLLYGESSNIAIQSGPTGITAGDPWAENLGKDNKIIDLQFHHILTAVRFSQGVIPAGLTITDIELEGVPVSASYNPERDDVNTGTVGTWTEHTGSATYSIKTNHIGGSSNVYIDNNQVFFMLPQTVGSGVKLNITLTDANPSTIEGATTKSHILSCSLQGDVWKKGYTVNYLITIGEVEEGYFLLEVSEQEMEHSNSISNNSFTLHSYRNYRDYSSGAGLSSKHVANWSVSGYSTTVDGTFTPDKPEAMSWLRSVEGTTTGTAGEYAGGYGATVNFSLNPQEYSKEANHDNVLGNNSAASTLDLSTHNPNGDSDDTETSNCYIVNRVGSYTFPLVYGNKTANGTEKACFKDHTGATISHKLIKDQMEAKNSGFTYELIEGNKYKKVSYEWDAAATASDGGKFLKGELVWQDVASLITKVSATSSDMSFDVGASKSGNAVLALKARKKITYYTYDGANYTLDTTQGNEGYGVEDTWETLWTWHIWMTDEVFANNGGSYDNQYLDHKDGEATPHDHIVSLYDGSTEVAKILPVNLGWVPDNSEFGYYGKREGWVELKQVGSNKTIKVKISQHARQPLITGTSTFYQWGRPTAFPATRNVAGTARTIYDIENNDISANFELAATTNAGDAIGKPYYVLQGTPRGDPNGPQDSWFDVANADYDNAMWNSETKTVYDPSPRGFRVPPASVFYGMSQTGTTESTSNKLNMYPSARNANGETVRSGEASKGGYFYCKAHTGEVPASDRYDDMVYMPATGQFHGNKTIGNKLNAATNSQLENANGIIWSSDYYDTGSGTEASKRQACVVWFNPDYDYSSGTATKPSIGFFDKSDHKMDYYGTLRAIRPMK